jgi:large subunit ribosomal protein L19
MTEEQNTVIKLTPVDMKSRKDLDFKAGDTVRVWNKIQEKGKTRLQAFEGLVLARKHGKEIGATFTVRKVASGVGVERIFPLYSPNIDKIEILRKSKTRRSKLYFIRTKAVKEVKKRLKSVTLSKEEQEKEETKE